MPADERCDDAYFHAGNRLNNTTLSVRFGEVAHASPEYWAACLLRDELLRAPLGLDLFSENLADESSYLHIGGFADAGRVVAYLQFKPIDESVLKMQQVAVAENLQGTGVGRSLMAFAEDFARGRGWLEIVLHAREEVVGFYETLDYERFGDRFDELGIPHFKMRKALR